jgi:alpha-glucosidase
MSQGTRCHQLAEYVVFFSPLSMLCDSPSQYEREKVSLRYIAKIPTVWDQTVVLDGKVGEYIVMARRSGSKWYVGALTSWTPREMTIDLTPILGSSGEFKAEVYRDGANAAERASDYKFEKMEVPTDRKLQVKMASGGGFAAVISKK